MEQKDFNRVLKKYRQGQASPEEVKMIDAWFDAMNRQPDTLLSEEKEEALEKRYWSSVAPHIRKSGGRNVFLWTATGIAASVTIALMAFIYWQNSKTGAAERSVASKADAALEWTAIANAKNTAQRFRLQDGSSVLLEPQSVIKLSPFFNRSGREVRLEGAAFFEVAHNEQQPFIVYAHKVTAKVLGTSFGVRAFKEDADVTVAVRTGRVSVSAERENSIDQKASLILTPNQEVVYNKRDEKILQKLVETPVPVLPAAEIKRMRFKGAPAKVIFEAIEKAYGVDIEFDEMLFSSCTLTTSISEGGLYNRLDIITSAIGAKYELKENRIVISGAGCD
ncbi:FecR domain-containing protein [Fulvivirgaceae bacterium PWU4]|uniref:FecR domain-containing protein n=1 Tax=Chryseosolibacter histidini TaxID=2782349 RepID=A0AAP2GJV2_9BACT|nr:FecR family protein [Chryseosolibacter histidini]MBT1698394.1 FecR domain-containing protein [Chryseosolibacter histidini]